MLEVMFLLKNFTGRFYLHLLVYPFVYQFNTKMTTLVESIFWNPAEPFSFILSLILLFLMRDIFLLVSLLSYSEIKTELIISQLPFSC
jgi:hypothetical protein